MTDSRYIRHYSVPGFSKEAQGKLAQKTVAVIGAGGLGCPVLMQLAGAGVGCLIIIEHDTVQLSNLPRQPLYTTADVGKLKSEAALERLTAINSEIIISAHNTRLTSENVFELLSPAGLVIDCSDNFSTRYLVNDACVLLNKPWVFGAIESWTGQSAAFNFPVGIGPTYRCIFPEPPANAPDCNEAGVLPPLPALVGSHMANAALQILAEIPSNGSGRIFNIDLLHHTFQSVNINRDTEAVGSITSLTQPEYDAAFCAADDIAISSQEYRANPAAYHIIDIREEFEFESKPSPGINIPYYALLANTGVLEGFGKTILLLCDTGKRSFLLAKKFRESTPETEVKSLTGGLAEFLP